MANLNCHICIDHSGSLFCKTLLHIVVECDSLSMSIIICLVSSKVASEDVMFSPVGVFCSSLLLTLCL